MPYAAAAQTHTTRAIRGCMSPQGAAVTNALGELQAGAFVRPTVLYPCNKEMRVWHEEQFGPLIPIAPFDSFEQCFEYLEQSSFGQQAALFTANPVACAPLIDVLTLSVGRVNINAQCQRGPDTFPFTGRKSSALGTLSVSEALKTVSIESVVATKDDKGGARTMLALATTDCNSVMSILH
jgi:glyceraldehyde-3-phosphate dehydrogenase (NADP+)